MTVTLSALPRDAEGRVVLPGRLARRTVVDFSTLSALPAEISAASVTGAGSCAITGSAANGTASLALTTEAVAGATSGFMFTAGVSLADVKAVKMSIDFTMPAAGYPGQLFIDITNGSLAGATWRRFSGAEPGSITDKPNGEFIYARALSAYSGRLTRMQRTLIIVPPTKTAALMEGDQVITAATFSAMAFTGTSYAKLTAQAGSAAVNQMFIHRASLETWI